MTILLDVHSQPGTCCEYDPLTLQFIKHSLICAKPLYKYFNEYQSIPIVVRFALSVSFSFDIFYLWQYPSYKTIFTIVKLIGHK